MTKTLLGPVGMCLAASLAACGGGGVAQETSPTSAPLNVPVTTAAMQSIANPLEAGGVMAADLSVTLTSRLIATVTSVRVHAGDRVRAGDVLVELDDRDVAARTREAEASVAAAEQGLAVATNDHTAAAADQTLAAATHARIASLEARHSATPQELDEAAAHLASATARADAAKARVAQSGNQLTAARAATDAAMTTQSFGVVRAPFDGLVTERLADPGTLASPGAPLVRLESSSALHVEVRIDEARQPYIRVGDRVAVFFDDRAQVPATGATVEGVVREVARVMADQRAFTVKVSLPRGNGLRSGTFARVRFRGPTRDALLIPALAVQRQGQLTSAFVVEDGVARLRLLRTGVESSDGVEVVAGLDAGEVIVAAPPPALVDGRRVVATGSAAGAARQ